MPTSQELEVQKKRQVKTEEERTAPVSIFVPTTDIYETDKALTVVVEMPGVDKSNVDIAVKDGMLTIDGKSIFRNTPGCSRSTLNTMSVITSAAFRCRTRSTLRAFAQRCATACRPSPFRRPRRPRHRRLRFHKFGAELADCPGFHSISETSVEHSVTPDGDSRKS